MILADTSVWIDHFRSGNDDLVGALNQDIVVTHDFVVGELACGNLQKRLETLDYLSALEHLPVAEHQEILAFIDMYQLFSSGLGYVDVHLLASCKLSGTRLWTFDKRLAKAAKALAVSD